MKKEPPVKEDGRIARSRRSREAIATAMLELVLENQTWPTSISVAHRAGVSPRLVFKLLSFKQSTGCTLSLPNQSEQVI